MRESPLGIVGLFVFIVGVFFAPAAHQINHKDDHQHGVVGHTHDAQGNDRPAPRDPQHGKGSLEHSGVAVTLAHAVVVAPCSILIEQDVIPPLQSTLVERFELGPLQPRAPPV